MLLKPKSTVHNPRALHFKRFTDLESSFGFRTIYRTTENNENYWIFDTEALNFVRTTKNPSEFQKVITVSEEAVYRYGNYAFRFANSKTGDNMYLYTWQRISLSDITADGSEVSITIEIGSFSGGGVNLPFYNGVKLDNVFTKPVDEVSILQTTGYNFLDCYVEMNIGDKMYHYGGDGADAASDYVVPSGTPKSFVQNGESPISGNEEPYYLAIGGLISPTEADNIFAVVKFRAKGLDLLSALFNDIAKYQTNKYYYAGSFDYMVRGSISSMDSQPIKGNIMHLRSFEIKYFDDSVDLDHDDLVVIDGHLYGVESIDYDVKRSPKPYTVYFATLNNIL